MAEAAEKNEDHKISFEKLVSFNFKTNKFLCAKFWRFILVVKGTKYMAMQVNTK